MGLEEAIHYVSPVMHYEFSFSPVSWLHCDDVSVFVEMVSFFVRMSLETGCGERKSQCHAMLGAVFG